MQRVTVHIFPSYLNRFDFIRCCPTLAAILGRLSHAVRWKVRHWDGFTDSLPDYRTIIFSSYAHGRNIKDYAPGTDPAALRDFCRKHGHFLVENEVVMRLLRGLPEDVLGTQFESFLAALPPMPDRNALAHAPGPSPVT